MDMVGGRHGRFHDKPCLCWPYSSSVSLNTEAPVVAESGATYHPNAVLSDNTLLCDNQ